MPGLVNVWLIVAPESSLEPVIPPVIVPTVQVKVLAALAVKEIFVLVTLQILFVAVVVTTGIGFTLTVIVKGVPGQEPVVEVGVITYSTVPVVILLGLVSVWLIGLPEPFTAPVIPPVIVPMVHTKLPVTLDVKAIFVLLPEQMLFVATFVTSGDGYTVMVRVKAEPAQEPVVEVGVIRYSTVPFATVLGLVNV